MILLITHYSKCIKDVQCTYIKYPGLCINTLLLNGFTLTRTQLNIDTEYWTLKTENWKLKLNTEHWTLNTKHWKLNTEHRKLNTIYTEHYTAQSGEPPDICRWIFWIALVLWYYGIMQGKVWQGRILKD